MREISKAEFVRRVQELGGKKPDFSKPYKNDARLEAGPGIRARGLTPDTRYAYLVFGGNTCLEGEFTTPSHKDILITVAGIIHNLKIIYLFET